MFKKRVFVYLVAVFLLIFAIFSGYLINKASSFVTPDNHFTSLAQSFIHNDLFLSPFNLPAGDYADFRARQYLFYGPLPSIILVPFVLIFGKEFPETFLSFVSLAVIYILIYLISKKYIGKKDDALMLANFFVFGTVLYFLGLIFITAYVAQVVATAFLIAAIGAYFYRINWFLIGVLVACAAITRFTLFAAALFFILEIIRLEKKNFARSIFYFLGPILIAVLLLGLYNHRRFGSFFETGYKYNITLKNYPLVANASAGLISIKHLPANLYFLLLKGPDPIKNGPGFVMKFPYLKADGWGMAIWYTSPLFLYLVKLRKSPYLPAALLTIVALAIPSLLYFGIGFTQYGYRYSLDFLPFMFLILIPTFKEGLPSFAKILIVGGVIFNCLYMLSIWDIYPLFNVGHYLRF